MASAATYESTHHSASKPKLKSQILLDKFTALSESPDAERIQKTGELLKHLAARQSSHSEDGICDEVSYSVSRLVQGLSSHRKFARLGYSVALCQILRSFDVVKADHVLECINEKAQGQLTGQVSKAETTNIYLGKLFGYLTLVHSGKLFLEGKQNVRQVVEELLKLGQEKSALQQLCVNGLIQVISQVKGKVFKKCILPQIESKFMEGWGNCTPDTLLLLLYSNKYHQKYVGKFLTEHWLDPQLVSEKNFPLIADVVKRSTSVYPLTHVINDELVKSVIEKNLDIVRFWSSVVRPLFDPKGLMVSKKALGLHYFDLLLPHLDTAEKLEHVIHPDVTNVLCLFGQKQDDLKPKITYTLRKIAEFVKSCKDSTLQLSVLKSLVQKPGHFHFDKRTKSTTLSTVVSHLLPDTKAVFMKELMKMFSGQPSWLYDKADNRTECEQWAVKELNVLVTMGDQSSSWQLDILQFLCLHSFFSVVEPSNDIPHCDHQTRELPDVSRKCVVDNFFKSVSKSLSHSIQGQSRATVLGNHLDVLYQLIQYCQNLLDSSSVVLHKELSELAQLEWTKMMEIVQKINKKIHTDDKIRDNHAFQLLFLHVGLQLFTDPEAAIESLQDLHVCYKKSTQRRKSKTANDGPEWIEVVTELLLSMVFKGTALSRNVAKLVLTTLADHITPQAFQLILNVFKQMPVEAGSTSLEEDSEGEDEEQMNVESEDDNDKDENISEQDDNDDNDNRDDDDDEEADKEEESDIEEEPDVNIDDELKKKVRSALGDAAVGSGSDDDDQAESDLSDSEMFKYDKMLAEAFKNVRKKEKADNKELRKQLNDFEMRVLDLIAVIVKHQPTSAHVRDLIFPLLDLMEEGKRKKDMRVIGKKATDVFDALYRVKKIIPDSSVDREELLDMVTKLIQYSNKVVSSDDIVKEVAKASLLVIRLLLNIEDNTGPSPLKTRSQAKVKAAEKVAKVTKDHDYYQEKVVQLIQASLHKLLHKTEGKQSPVFVHTIIERYPLMFWSLSEELLSTLGDVNLKVYQRTQACGMLASLMNKQLKPLRRLSNLKIPLNYAISSNKTVLIICKAAEIGEDSWKDFLGILEEKSTKILSSLSPEAYKAQFIKELLTVYGRVASISSDDLLKVLGESGLQQLDSLKTVFSTDMRTLFKKVTKPLRQRADSVGEGKKKKKNRKRSRSGKEGISGGDETSPNPGKIVKIDNIHVMNNNNENVKVNEKSLRDDKHSGTEVKDNDDDMKNGVEYRSERKKKRKRSKSIDSCINADHVGQNKSLNADRKMPVASDSDPNKITYKLNGKSNTDSNSNETEDNEEVSETPKSKKKQRKRKSSKVNGSITG